MQVERAGIDLLEFPLVGQTAGNEQVSGSNIRQVCTRRCRRVEPLELQFDLEPLDESNLFEVSHNSETARTVMSA